MHFRNISQIMDCVGCDKCRLWGKLQVNLVLDFIILNLRVITNPHNMIVADPRHGHGLEDPVLGRFHAAAFHSDAGSQEG